jgi:hypothetical protein
LPNATLEEIDAFLENVRRVINKNKNNFFPRYSKKNKSTLLTLGYDWNTVVQEIVTLSAENYSEGPIEEIGTINFVWIFGKIIKNQEVYIKIKLIGMNNLGEEIDTVYCMSFHFSEECLIYPYKK